MLDEALAIIAFDSPKRRFRPSGESFMSVLPIAKTLGKIAPGHAGAELPDDRLHEQPVALVAVAPDMAGAAGSKCSIRAN